MSQSPLKEADPKSLEVLFNKNPRDLQDDEIAIVVAALRAERARWDTQEKMKAAKKQAITAETNLDDILKGL